MDDGIMKAVFPEQWELTQSGKCPICKKEIVVTDFKDSLSRKEFSISGMCQSCQDSFFDE
jgi:uncharacterized CHY-type Zn-finger protein